MCEQIGITTITIVGFFLLGIKWVGDNPGVIHICMYLPAAPLRLLRSRPSPPLLDPHYVLPGGAHVAFSPRLAVACYCMVGMGVFFIRIFWVKMNLANSFSIKEFAYSYKEWRDWLWHIST